MAGRQVSIFYDDGAAVSCKSGEVVEQDAIFISIRIFDGKLISIPVNRIIRMEEVRR